jgi:hypothetical protein
MMRGPTLGGDGFKNLRQFLPERPPSQMDGAE